MSSTNILTFLVKRFYLSCENLEIKGTQKIKDLQ